MRDEADRQSGEGDRPDCQLKNDSQISSEIPPHGEKRTGQQERRQKKYEGQIRIKLDIWHPWNERQCRSAQDEGSSRWKSRPPGQKLQPNDSRHQEKDEFEA
jgi:hypothetical protein